MKKGRLKIYQKSKDPVSQLLHQLMAGLVGSVYKGISHEIWFMEFPNYDDAFSALIVLCRMKLQRQIAWIGKPCSFLSVNWVNQFNHDCFSSTTSTDMRPHLHIQCTCTCINEKNRQYIYLWCKHQGKQTFFAASSVDLTSLRFVQARSSANSSCSRWRNGDSFFCPHLLLTTHLSEI